MGSKISAEAFYKDAEIISSRIVRGPPNFVKLNVSQKDMAKNLTVKLNATFEFCKYIRIYAQMIKPKEADVKMALPNEDVLLFNKQEMLTNSIIHISDIEWHAKQNGFISNISLAYLGRLLVALQSTIDDDIKNNDDIRTIENIKDIEVTIDGSKTKFTDISDIDKLINISFCKESIDESLKILKQLCLSLSENSKESYETVWILDDDAKILNKWNGITIKHNE